jgi:hypothetical protein
MPLKWEMNRSYSTHRKGAENAEGLFSFLLSAERPESKNQSFFDVFGLC